MAPLCSRQSAPPPARGTLKVLQSDSHDFAATLLERGQVARRLRADQPPEAELPPRDRDLPTGIVDDLNEEAGIRTAFVQLAGGVEIPRAEPVRHDAAGLVRAVDQRLELGLARRIDERLDRDVVAGPGLIQQLVERALRLHVRLTSGREDLVRPVLRGLNVRLVERVDLEDRAGDRGCELPPEELLAELVRRGQPHLGRLPVTALGSLAGRRHEALPVLSRRLGEQLLRPQPGVAGVRVDRDLVAAVAPAVPELEPELEAGVALLAVAGLDHLVDPLEEALDVDAHQRGRHDAEGRERRVAASDRRLAVEDRRETALARE